MRRITLFILMVVGGINVFSLEIKGDTIVDYKKNSIEKKSYKRIVIIDPAVVETFFMIGAENKIVAIANTTTTKIWPEDKTNKLPRIGTITKPSLEHIISYSPDLVVLNPMTSSIEDSLRERKIPFIINSGTNFNEILSNIKVYGVISGNEDNAKILKKSYEEKLDHLTKEIVKKPLNLKGAFLFSSSPLMAFNEKSLPGEVFNILGIENIAENISGDRPILSPEYLIFTNPDILLGSMGISKEEDIIKSNPFIESTNAGRDGNIFLVESDKILRPSPRIIETVIELYNKLDKVNEKRP